MTPGNSTFGRTRRGIAAAVPAPALPAAAVAAAPGFGTASVDGFAWGRSRAAAVARAAVLAPTAGGRAPGHDLLDRLRR